jgi:hypothetical protein
MSVATEQELSLVLEAFRRLSSADSPLLPKLLGEDPVPAVSGLVVTATTQLFGSTHVTLRWTAPEYTTVKISTYRVYAKNILSSNAVPLLVGEFTDAPAQVTVTSDSSVNVILLVQTVLANGLVNSFDKCPTVAVGVTVPTTTIPDGSITTAKLAANAIDVSKYAAGQRPLQIVAGPGNPALPSATYPSGSVILNLTDSKVYRTSDGLNWTKALDGADIVANSIVAGSFAAGAITANDIQTAAITATKLNIADIIVVGMTLTNNSPAAGRIAWSACTVYYAGSSYSIASGNTALTTNKFVTWTVGAGSFVASDSFTPAQTIYLIATNTSGTADTAWNKLAMSHVQEDQLAVSLLKGFAIQPPATLTTTNLVVPSSGGATSVTTNLLTVSQGAALVSLRLRVDTPITVNAAGSASGDINIYVKITVDGATAQTLKLFEQIPAGSILTSAPLFDDQFRTFETTAQGNGTAAMDYVTSTFGLSASSSLIVDLYITDSNASGILASRTLTGQFAISCGYALKVS